MFRALQQRGACLSNREPAPARSSANADGARDCPAGTVRNPAALERFQALAAANPDVSDLVLLTPAAITKDNFDQAERLGELK